MPLYRCLTPPAAVTVKIGDFVEVFEFPDDSPVEVSEVAEMLLGQSEEDEFELVMG